MNGSIDSTRMTRGLVLLLVLCLSTGCAAKRAFSDGQRDMSRKNYDEAVLKYSKALSIDPGNTRYSVALARAKVNSSMDHFQKGKRFASAQQYEMAVAEFQQTLLLDPGHQHALSELQRAIRELQQREAIPSEIEQLKARARRKDLGPPKLDPSTNIPILFSFNDTKLSKIFEAIGKASGINFIFDDKTDLDKSMTIDIGNVTLEQALDILMLQTKNFYKPIDEHTLLVATDSRQKRQEYDDQVIRTFFLSNADTKEVVTLLRSLLQARQIAENTDLNSVTIKDAPDTVAIAERIINSNDKAKGEVLIDVELLEVNRSVSRSVGLDLSSKLLSLTYRDGQASVALNDLDSLKKTGNWTVGIIPSVVLNFLKTDGDTRIIAKPQLRVSEGEQAEILIGDRVPIPTTSFNTSQTVGGNIVPITSFTYQNVGITVQIEPRVHHNKEVTLKIQVEISALGAPLESGGQSQPTIGTRQIQTVIRLRDGETNLLAGLIQRTDSDSRSGVAGLSDIPGLRRLLGTSRISHTDTDIIMTLTPRIIRTPDITEEDLATLWVGTEENMRLRGPARNALNQSPFASADAMAAAQGADPLATAPLQRTGGTLQRIVSNPEVERDRQDAAREREEADRQAEEPAAPPPVPAAQAPQPSGDSQQPEPEPEPESEPAPQEEAPTGPALVQLVPSSTAVEIGDTIAVNVNIANAHNVGSVPFHLRFDPAVVQFAPPAVEGSFLNGDGTQTAFFTNAQGNEVVVGLSRLGGGAGASGEGVLASFQFVAVGEGDAGFAFTGFSVKDPRAINLNASPIVLPVRVGAAQ